MFSILQFPDWLEDACTGTLAVSERIFSEHWDHTDDKISMNHISLPLSSYHSYELCLVRQVSKLVHYCSFSIWSYRRSIFNITGNASRLVHTRAQEVNPSEFYWFRINESPQVTGVLPTLIWFSICSCWCSLVVSYSVLPVFSQFYRYILLLNIELWEDAEHARYLGDLVHTLILM